MEAVRRACQQASGFGLADAEMLSMDDKELNQRVPLRFVKSPYAEHDEKRLKKRQKRMHWETLKEERRGTAGPCRPPCPRAAPRRPPSTMGRLACAYAA